MNKPHAIRSVLGTIVLSTVITTIASPLGQAQLIAPPSVPSNLKVPEGNELFLKASAVGTQNYMCLPSGWTFIGPQATLFVTVPWFGGSIRQQVATHFLTPNPVELPTSRPLWQSSLDSSIVWGRQKESSTDSNYVDANAIAWLLLEAAGNQNGPSGGKMLSQTTFIQRINTSGGMKPTNTCSVGDREFVPYTADYVFYRKAN